MSAIRTYVHNQATAFSIHGFVSVAVNANYLRDLLSEEALTNSTSLYAFVERSDFIFTLTLRLLMSYIYGAPSKARNANVVYIWTYVWQR